MHKSLVHLFTIGLLAAIAITHPVRSHGDEKKPAAAAEEGEKKITRIPFNGKIHSVDKSAMTITLDGKERKRVIQLTTQTRIAKAGKAATLDDAVVGEEVGGQIARNAAGKEEAVSVRLGAKAEEKPKKAESK